VNRLLAVAIAVAACWFGAYPDNVAAKIERSKAARAAFMKQAPCPATGLPRGACPGYVVDHIVPLCAGGPDAPINMQWQALAESLEKDKAERRQCRR